MDPTINYKKNPDPCPWGLNQIIADPALSVLVRSRSKVDKSSVPIPVFSERLNPDPDLIERSTPDPVIGF